MNGLPTHLPEWKAWRVEILRRIREGDAENDLCSLVQGGCDCEELLFRLAAVVAWANRRTNWRTTGLTRHKVKVAPAKMREAAKLVERFQDVLPMPPEVSLRPGELCRSLRAYAEKLEESKPFLLGPDRLSLGVGALCSLVGYVKHATRKNYDQEVSGLICAVLGKDNYAATHLVQWRSRHRKEIDLMGCVVVNPLSVPVPQN